LRIFWARMRRRIRFLRHFHRMWPRFFQTRDERFIPPSADSARTGRRLKGLLSLQVRPAVALSAQDR